MKKFNKFLAVVIACSLVLITMIPVVFADENDENNSENELNSEVDSDSNFETVTDPSVDDDSTDEEMANLEIIDTMSKAGTTRSIRLPPYQTQPAISGSFVPGEFVTINYVEVLNDSGKSIHKATDKDANGVLYLIMYDFSNFDVSEYSIIINYTISEDAVDGITGIMCDDFTIVDESFEGILCPFKINIEITDAAGDGQTEPETTEDPTTEEPSTEETTEETSEVTSEVTSEETSEETTEEKTEETTEIITEEPTDEETSTDEVTTDETSVAETTAEETSETVIINPPLDDDDNDNEVNIGAGIIITISGSVLLLIVIAGVAFLYIRRKKMTMDTTPLVEYDISEDDSDYDFEDRIFLNDEFRSNQEFSRDVMLNEEETEIQNADEEVDQNVNEIVDNDMSEDVNKNE